MQVLFKNLGVKDVPPTSFLKDRVRVVEGNPDFSIKEIVASQPQPVVSESKSGVGSALNHIDLPFEISNPSLSGGHAHMMSQVGDVNFIILQCCFLLMKTLLMKQYDGSRYSSSGSIIEQDKLGGLGLPDQISSAQGMLQAASQSFPVGQVCI